MKSIIKTLLKLIIISILCLCFIDGHIHGEKAQKIINKQAKTELINPTKRKYKMTSPYGWRKQPINGIISFHNGEDYATPMYTKLYSPAAGKVKRVFKNGIGGLQIIISHDNGFSTGYAHLSSINVKKGDRLEKGEYFAKTGNTGYSTGPHLHLTLRNKKGKLTAPSNYLYK